MARMAVSWDTHGGEVEIGRIRGEPRHDVGRTVRRRNDALAAAGLSGEFRRTSLPAHMAASHGHLTEEFVRAILEDRKPLVDIALALNLTVSGIVAHHSALRDGELLKIPQFT